jgi:uncharacterized protein YjeT (DUF2065 family)
MSAIQFIQWLTQTLYILSSIVVTIAAVRRPTRVRVDIALFFGVVTVIIAQGWIYRALGIPVGRVSNVLIVSLLMLLPYLLLRLVNDFTTMPTRILRAAAIGLACAVAGVIAFPPPLPLAVTLLLVLYFFVVTGYVAATFLRAARRTSGVTRRRMQAVAYGAGFLGLTILLAGLNAVAPWAIREEVGLIQQLASLASGVSYFIGFAPPSILRRAWQEPELRAFLGRAASLPRLPDTAAIVREFGTRRGGGIGRTPRVDRAVGRGQRQAALYRSRRAGTV